MIVFHSLSYSERLLSLRAKVSHTWLDHEIAMVDTSLALDRWRSSAWGQMAKRWPALHGMAAEFALHLSDYSAAYLVDQLAPLQALTVAEKAELKVRLNQLHDSLMDTEAIRMLYEHKLANLWQNAEHFFGLAIQPFDAKLGPELTQRWAAVQLAADDLKQMFTNGQLPAGVLLP